MTDYPSLLYSKKDIERAGNVIKGDLLWNSETEHSIRHAFRVANNWRDSHAFPMASIRSQLTKYVSHLGLSGFAAARLKRMQAIRRKLRRPNFKPGLATLQDLAGCRVVLSSIDEVNFLTETLLNKTRHDLKYRNDYIVSPKDDGYRSNHLIFSFHGQGKTELYSGRRVEVQIRTRLQHSWATAVEAIGLFRGEDRKWGKFAGGGTGALILGVIQPAHGEVGR